MAAEMTPGGRSNRPAPGFNEAAANGRGNTHFRAAAAGGADRLQ